MTPFDFDVVTGPSGKRPADPRPDPREIPEPAEIR